MNQSCRTLCTLLFIGLLVISNAGYGQRSSRGKSSPPVFVDKEGVLRWTGTKAEASFFGVNYTTPFAYAYRAHKAVNADLEQAIRNDVYHMARLGFNAFRVHVWDNEISDVNGNLLENDHLRLFDFLLAELKKRNIRTIITPIAFWGNGYPERDKDVPGFSQFYGRGKLTTNDSAIVAQENYLGQFFNHVNPYTKLAYKDDPDVVATEINNEPSHSGPKEGVTRYVNRLAAAIKAAGWRKPVYYNISQGPFYADAVAVSDVDGFSFQWYPAGLVSGNTLPGNYLPHVDKYTIPFDTIPAFRKKALMVYEFDAADILQPTMYPFMAKSFREAGFQWATQFAYDPLAIAHANTEYQTHYLNLAYTPAKAISMLIASRVFHRVPRLKNYGNYPADSVFDAFRVSFKKSLSEMNTDQEFYYSNSTDTNPVDAGKLQHVAGVGSSPLVNYDGSGAYFLDKVENGVWRLEVMPDAIHIRDPFERASPKKEVTRIQWQSNRMRIRIPELGNDFDVSGLNEGNTFTTTASSNGFAVSPGTYLVSARGRKFSGRRDKIGALGMNEFVAPGPVGTAMYLRHEPFTEVTAGNPFLVRAVVVGLDSGTVSLQIGRLSGQSRTIPMKRKSTNEYEAEVPVELVSPGRLQYRITLRSGPNVLSFPGSIGEDPSAWDSFSREMWTTFVAASEGSLSIFDPTRDHTIRPYPTWRRGFQTSYVTGENPGELILRMTANNLKDIEMMGFQFAFAGKWVGRQTELSSFSKVVVRARSSDGKNMQAKLTLIDENGSAMSANLALTGEFRDFEIPLSSFTSDEGMLTPRPYPGFLPLTFKGPVIKKLNLSTLERVEMTIGSGIGPADAEKSYGFEVARIWSRK